MANLIDSTYFVGEINLPGSALTGDYANISQFIAKYEPIALRDLLGPTLAADLQSEIGAEEYSTKWDRLVNGHTYTVDFMGDSHTVEWNGLINTDKISMLAYFIYFKYVGFHVTHTSRVGEVLLQSENANRHSVNMKLVNAWNEYIRLRGSVSDYDIEPTAYNLIKKYENDDTNPYDKWVFTELARMNIMGI